jgi:hypothetical protein
MAFSVAALASAISEETCCSTLCLATASPTPSRARARDLLLDHAPTRRRWHHHHYRGEMREAIELWANHVERFVMPEGVKVLR